MEKTKAKPAAKKASREMKTLQLTKVPSAKTEMLIRKPAAEVFDAFVNPEITTKFWFTKSTGKLEAGKQVRWDWEMYNISVKVNVKEIEQNKRILIEWSDNGNPSIAHPALVNKMVIISTVYKYEGWLPETRELFKSFTPEFLDNTPLKTEYDKIAPNPEHWHEFVVKFIEFDKQDFNLGEENMKAIKSPILFIMGDNDEVDLTHKDEMYKLCGGNVFGDVAGLPKNQLAIFPGTTHISLISETKKLVELINPFLDKN